MEMKGIFITEENMPQFVSLLAKRIKEELMVEDKDDYLTPDMIAEKVPTLTASKIKDQVRSGKYGRKIGAKGKLVAKVSEVKRYNRL